MFDNIDNDALSYIVQRFLINRISFVEARNARVIRPFLKDQLYQTTSVSQTIVFIPSTYDCLWWSLKKAERDQKFHIPYRYTCTATAIVMILILAAQVCKYWLL